MDSDQDRVTAIALSLLEKPDVDRVVEHVYRSVIVVGSLEETKTLLRERIEEKDRLIDFLQQALVELRHRAPQDALRSRASAGGRAKAAKGDATREAVRTEWFVWACDEPAKYKNKTDFAERMVEKFEAVKDPRTILGWHAEWAKWWGRDFNPRAKTWLDGGGKG